MIDQLIYTQNKLSALIFNKTGRAAPEDQMLMDLLKNVFTSKGEPVKLHYPSGGYMKDLAQEGVKYLKNKNKPQNSPEAPESAKGDKPSQESKPVQKSLPSAQSPSHQMPDWFKSLSRPQQQKYLKEHPQSKEAPSGKSDAIVPEVLDKQEQIGPTWPSTEVRSRPQKNVEPYKERAHKTRRPLQKALQPTSPSTELRKPKDESIKMPGQIPMPGAISMPGKVQPKKKKKMKPRRHGRGRRRSSLIASRILDQLV